LNLGRMPKMKRRQTMTMN